MNNKIWKRNITLDYLFCFCRNFNITNAIWVLYMIYKGLPLWQVGIVEGIFHLASFLFEVPSGAMADLLGRKRVCILGRVISAISSVMVLLSQGIVGFSIAFIFSALSYNLNFGSEEALVYDSMKAIHEEKNYIKVNSRLNIITEIASGIGTVVGGILAEQAYTTCYLVAILIALFSILPACFLKEPPMGEATMYSKTKDDVQKISLKEHFIISAKVINENPAVIKILIYYPTVAAFIMSISIIFVAFNQMTIILIAFLIASFVNPLLYPIESASLNALIPSEQRATIISVDSMCFSMAMIVFFPLSGLLATIVNLQTTFLVLGGVELFLSLSLLYNNASSKK